jgi:hypothetical protein
MYGFGQSRGPHDDVGDIELCIKVARKNMSYGGMTEEEAVKDLIARRVASYAAHNAVKAATILLKDV